MNEIYREYWNPLQNYFIPTFKIKEKIRIGAKLKKTYGPPLTPYERLMNSSALGQDQKTILLNNKNNLNPLELKLGLEKKVIHHPQSGGPFSWSGPMGRHISCAGQTRSIFVPTLVLN